ncbi:MAG: hypothetical protein V9F00_17625 [Nocardioides sp.]
MGDEGRFRRSMWVRTPTRELALLRIPLARFYGDKLTFAFLGLLIPPLLAVVLRPARTGIPRRDPGDRLARVWRA